MKPSSAAIAAVVIGRNEGARLLGCLDSIAVDIAQIVYVDSGSTDGSVDAARARGAEVIDLDTSIPFTAARARNAGIAALRKGVHPEYVQFVDGDCSLQPGWVNAAAAFLDAHRNVAIVFGRRRERFPEKSLYNRMCDDEWNTPLGEATECGGDILARWSALEAVGGYSPGLIAGEEPDLCLRLRRKGWKIWRLDADMTLHDAALTRFGQFWQRARRAGHAVAEGHAMYGRAPEQFRVAEMRRILVWGVAIPLIIFCGWLFVGAFALFGLLIYPLQVIRLARREGADRFAWEKAFLLTVGKFAELRGVIDYYWRRLRGHQATLIEYK